MHRSSISNWTAGIDGVSECAVASICVLMKIIYWQIEPDSMPMFFLLLQCLTHPHAVILTHRHKMAHFPALTAPQEGKENIITSHPKLIKPIFSNTAFQTCKNASKWVSEKITSCSLCCSLSPAQQYQRQMDVTPTILFSHLSHPGPLALRGETC